MIKNNGTYKDLNSFIDENYNDELELTPTPYCKKSKSTKKKIRKKK